MPKAHLITEFGQSLVHHNQELVPVSRVSVQRLYRRLQVRPLSPSGHDQVPLMQPH